jgi:cohesin complex subunit SCC1
MPSRKSSKQKFGQFQSGRASFLNESSTSSKKFAAGGSQVTEVGDNDDFPMNNGGDLLLDDDGDQPPAVDDDGEERQRSVRLSLSRDDSTAAAPAGISFGEDEEEESVDTKRKSASPSSKKQQRRRTKRRKVIMDANGVTQLSNEHIRSMIADTSDITLPIVHPSTWVPGVTKSFVLTDQQVLYKYLSHEELFCRPSLGDDGQLAPELIALWKRHNAPILGKPFPYKMQEDEADEEEEVARQAQAEGDEEEETSMHSRAVADDDDMPFPENDDPFPEGNGGGIPFDDEEEPPPLEDDRMSLGPDSPGNSSQKSFESIFSLGATNGLDEDDLDRADDAVTAATSKWHKNTIKVFAVLKKSMAPQDDDDDSDVDAAAPKSEMSFEEISKGVTRRTAAGVFFELLQLKTLNYIELNQDESFGDILISPGVKFLEDPPVD